MDEDGEIFFEYGTTSGDLTLGSTSVMPAVAGEPVEVVIGGLDPNMKYYYRLNFQPTGGSVWTSGDVLDCGK